MLNVITEGLPAGGSLNKLMAANFDPRVLRPWQDTSGQNFFDRPDGSVSAAMAGSATLKRDEWLDIDSTVIEVARTRLRGIRDLETYGLVKTLPNALGKTMYGWETVSDMGPDQVNMDMVLRPQNERLLFGYENIPLPVSLKGFDLNARFLAVTRRDGSGIDTAQARKAAMKVVEGMEDRLFNGWGFSYGGGTLYGYTTYPHRNTGSLLASWTDSGTTGVMCLKDILAMKEKLRLNKQHGEVIIYISPDYEKKLDEDYKSESNITIRERILQLSGIREIAVSDFLPYDTVLMIQLDRGTIELIKGMDPTTVQWDSEGGARLHFKIIALSVPRFSVDDEANCGIVHFTAP